MHCDRMFNTAAGILTHPAPSYAILMTCRMHYAKAQRHKLQQPLSGTDDGQNKVPDMPQK